ncbi:MAG: peptidylprolyl isomerase [Anaerophaga sp.]|uniref:peptidylprolyl isomerase n=1 Tax=Anaerophaga thermohalophila TaxID=177400 RepID=UPI000237C06D|nr:peptidylprolyl isomerase [Anaerophaga thermohalophila]MBZ4677316.1 peptidylprolyl isomerase [Anaerophaga sp.]MDI3520958.1 peptidyl-prolyl cis-trans isomerase [Anaerophaga sp.]MDN5292637.1 peptidyl-prolyl cis-trans isomerase [Anaerophaga sp.]
MQFKYLNFVLKNPIILILLISFLSGCKSPQKRSEQTQQPKGSYQANIKGMVEIHTFDHYNRVEKKGFGFFIDRDLVVTNLEWIKGAYKAKIAPPGTKDYKDVRGYTAYDHNLDLVILKVKRNNPNYIKLTENQQETDSLYTLRRPSRKLYVRKGVAGAFHDMDSISFLEAPAILRAGKPAFRLNHELLGIVQEREVNDSLRKVVLSQEHIAALLKKQTDRPVSVWDLRTKTDKVYISHEKVAGFRIKTTMGNIVISLYDETPRFRDNFIKLVSDHFYDSLLVHRVLKDFLIQTGAADSKYAGKDDIVGWQGPGYNLPTKIVPSRFHKRGAVAASKLPPDRNPGNRSDGSQFYIISGRVFTHEELDEIEEEKGFRFTPSQREIYTTVGGAPYLDGDYTVFGEVTDGMDVVDRIAAVETYGENRPVNDIRIKTIDIIQKIDR